MKGTPLAASVFRQVTLPDFLVRKLRGTFFETGTKGPVAAVFDMKLLSTRGAPTSHTSPTTSSPSPPPPLPSNHCPAIRSTPVKGVPEPSESPPAIRMSVLHSKRSKSARVKIPVPFRITGAYSYTIGVASPYGPSPARLRVLQFGRIASHRGGANGYRQEGS